MGLGAEPKASPPTVSRDPIGLIDLPMPEKTHNEFFRFSRPFGAAA